MTRLSVSVALVGVALVGVSVPAHATGGHDKPKPDTSHRAVCHPTGSSTTTTHSPRRSVPSSTVAPPELAHTGAELVAGFLVGLGILLVGALFHAARILGRKGTHR